MASAPVPLGFRRLCHINALVGSYRSAINHLVDVYGSIVHFESTTDGRRVALLNIGGVLFEVMALPPAQVTEQYDGVAPGLFVGAEYCVDDVAEARRRCQALGLAVIREKAAFFHTGRADCHGISWEVCGDDWQRLVAPGEIQRRAGWCPAPSAAYWRLEHPLGLTGLVRLSVAVTDSSIAAARLSQVTGAERAYEVERSAVGAVAVGMRLGDTTVELLAPRPAGPPGPVHVHLAGLGEGNRSGLRRRRRRAGPTSPGGRWAEGRPG